MLYVMVRSLPLLSILEGKNIKYKRLTTVSCLYTIFEPLLMIAYEFFSKVVFLCCFTTSENLFCVVPNNNILLLELYHVSNGCSSVSEPCLNNMSISNETLHSKKYLVRIKPFQLDNICWTAIKAHSIFSCISFRNQNCHPCIIHDKIGGS
jgi:hypothetical protein